MGKPIRLAVVGGRRGASFGTALEFLRERVRLTAMCDLRDSVRARWQQAHPEIVACREYERLLRDDVCDAVLIATPMQLHAPMAIAALRAGKHVFSEVPACLTHAEALELLQAVREGGQTYMMGENCIYRREPMMVLNMVERGVFGELTYAEGMYLHECWSYLYDDDGTLRWSGELARDLPGGNSYPTHSIGPIARWLGIGPEPKGDRFATLYSVSTAPASLVAHTVDRFGPGHPGADPAYWKLGDSNSCLIRTRRGRVISLRGDWISPRPHHMAVHELQGTRACIRTATDPADEPGIWIQDRSPGPGRQWEKLSRYTEEFEHPRWKQRMAVAQRAGHGGGDFFEIEDFVDAIDGRAPNAIDVSTAVSWSSIVWLSQESERLGRAVDVPDYFHLQGRSDEPD